MRKLSLSSLEKKLDRVFSEYIRLRDADKGGTVQCVTCKKLMFWKDSHAGHFVKRQHRSLRWNELNAHPQCVACNTYQGGRQDDYAAYIIKRYGVNAFNKLVEMKYQIAKFSRADLMEMIERFKGLLNERTRITS